MEKQEVLDTLKAATSYLNSLKLLNIGIEGAVKQIITSFEETELQIHDTFSNLKQNLLNILNKRETTLLNNAKQIKIEGLTPLEQCQNVILERIQTTNKLIEVGNSVLNGSGGKLESFTRSSSLLGALPEVPELKEVPFISFRYDPSSGMDLNEIFSHFGQIYSISPIQITELVEKPGAILVEWQSIENDDRSVDIQEFRLQRAFGDVTKERHLVLNFSDCYRGLDTQFLVKDLQINQLYSFRICCKWEGISEWSPWSLPQVFCTTLMPFSWRNHDDYFLSNENKIAKPLVDNPRVLYSDGSQFAVGYSIEFTLLEVDSSDAVIGLLCTYDTNSTSTLYSAGGNSFLINHKGKIFVDGGEKSTKLPDFYCGLKVCFTCELVNKEKVRVHIDANDKRVTYDWLMNQGSEISFGCQFFSSKWKIMIE
ncbi:hypothetical protein NQ317_004952 [Molorchus minor]|uniref:Fibronectin type-III domain-containing protein n=1 Tax=Molorchus minor TaxID=1323400 RepID=A0ABQ9K238_9CUCU|nr:hypothetical protein NQ317_004952 [Molorchus minor]